MPPRDDDYDRPKKSWSEIDKARDGRRSSGRSSSGSGDADRARMERSPMYSRYKSAADQFFSGNLVPDGLGEKLDPNGEGKAQLDALKKLRDADDFKVFAQLSSEFVETYGLPEDPYLLDRLLGHPKDTLVLKTLERLTEMLSAGTLKVPKALGQRLKSLEIGSDNPEIQDNAKALIKELRAKSLI
jgi:hypothetical protein